MNAAPARRHSSERGAELVEFALALPMLLLVFAGIVDFGLLLQRHQVLSNAVREGARLAVLPNYGLADVQARVQDYVREGISDNAASPSTSLDIVTLTPAAGPPFQAARVHTTLTYRFLILGPIVNLAGGRWSFDTSITLQATSTMRTESISGS
jgi:Flp pilus assembly protein TadG